MEQTEWNSYAKEQIELNKKASLKDFKQQAKIKALDAAITLRPATSYSSYVAPANPLHSNEQYDPLPVAKKIYEWLISESNGN